MTLPTGQMSLSEINTELLHGSTRQTSISELNVIEDDPPNLVKWDSLRGKRRSVTINSSTAQFGSGNISTNLDTYFWVDPNALFSIDWRLNGWENNHKVERVFFQPGAINGLIRNISWPINKKYHTFQLYIYSTGAISSSFWYSGKKTDNDGGRLGIGKLSYWAPGTTPYGHGSVQVLDTGYGGVIWGNYNNAYLNNNL